MRSDTLEYRLLEILRDGLDPAVAEAAVITPPQTDDELWEVTRQITGLEIPRTAVCENHVAPFTAFADAYFARWPVCAWKASRGLAGKSVTLAALSMVEAITLGASVSLLGGSGEQSKRVHDYMTGEDTNLPGKFWKNQTAPRALLRGSSATLTRLTNNGRIKVLMASQTSVRGPHPQRLRCLAAGTMVAAPGGPVPIEELRVGQLVWAFTRQAELVTRPVAAVWSSGVQPTITLTFTGLVGERVLTLTANHPVLTTEGEWRPAGELRPGDRVVAAGPAIHAIPLTKIEDGPAVEVWDAAVPGEDGMTGHFIAEGIVVHNCDEVDEMNLEILESALGQPMAARGIESQVVLSSTHQYPNGTMTEVLKRASAGQYRLYQWCWRETVHGWLTPTDVERKRQMVTKQTWDTEYDLQEPAIHDRAIDTEKVEAAFFGPEIDAYPGDYLEFEGPAEWEEVSPEGRTRKRRGTYVTAADWAKKQDWTVIVTFRTDVTPVRLVAFEFTGRLPWPDMVARFEFQVRRYGGEAIHDATGLGTVIDDLLYVSAYPMVMVGRARRDMFSNYIGGIERGEFRSPRIKFMYNEHKYCRVGDLYSESGHPPDSFVAGALAWSLFESGWSRPAGGS